MFGTGRGRLRGGGGHKGACTARTHTQMPTHAPAVSRNVSAALASATTTGLTADWVPFHRRGGEKSKHLRIEIFLPLHRTQVSPCGQREKMPAFYKWVAKIIKHTAVKGKEK